MLNQNLPINASDTILISRYCPVLQLQSRYRAEVEEVSVAKDHGKNMNVPHHMATQSVAAVSHCVHMLWGRASAVLFLFVFLTISTTEETGK